MAAGTGEKVEGEGCGGRVSGRRSLLLPRQCSKGLRELEGGENVEGKRCERKSVKARKGRKSRMTLWC